MEDDMAIIFDFASIAKRMVAPDQPLEIDANEKQAIAKALHLIKSVRGPVGPIGPTEPTGSPGPVGPA